MAHEKIEEKVALRIAQLEERNKVVVGQKKVVEERNSQLDERYKVVVEQKKVVEERNSQLDERNKVVVGQKKVVEERNSQLEERDQIVKIEKRKSDDLLLNILPAEVAEELKETGLAHAKQFNNVTVLFTDFVNFTGISQKMSPTELVAEIHKNFSAFDDIIEKHGLEKIKTIGDAYMAACGLHLESKDHAQRVINAAFEISDSIAQSKSVFQIRIGVNSGPVVAGIVGVKKYAYDIWGDTVNTASRMESNSEPGKVNISESTYALVKDDFTFENRGKITVKGKGEIEMYFVEK